MNKTLRTLAFTSAVAFFGSSAYATGNQEQPERGHNGHQRAVPTVVQQGQGQQQGQRQGQQQGQGQAQTANGTGIGVGTATAGATAATGPITNTNGAVAETGPIDVNAAGGAANAATGPITVAPNQSTVNSFRSFVGTNAPGLSGAVDNCLAIVGWSAAVNVFGSTGVGVGGGNQRAEFVEQCSAVKSAFEVWNRANGDVAKETFAIEMLIKALPNYAKPAMDSAVTRINAYVEANGAAEPDSVMTIFGATALKKKAVEPVVVAPVRNDSGAAAQAGVTLVVNPVVHTVETHTKETRVVVQQKQPKPPVLAPGCDYNKK